MLRRSSSAAGVRFLASVKEGRGLKPSARDAGIDKEVGYRWLRDKYLVLRRDGKTPAESTAELGFTSSRVLVWEADVDRTDDRHHLRVDVDQEATFWASFDAGRSADAGAQAAGVSRSTAYRWIVKRFSSLRIAGHTVRHCQTQLRLTEERARIFEERRLKQLRQDARAARAAQHEAVLSSGRYADRVLVPESTAGQERLRVRAEKYWQLMRDGLSNAEACRLLGMHRATGTHLRQATSFQIPRLAARRRQRAATLMRASGSRSRTCCAWASRCAGSRQRSAGSRPPSLGSWPGIETTAGTTCPRQRIMTPGFSVLGPRFPSSSQTPRCGV